MATRKIELSEALHQIQRLSKEDMLTSVVIAGGAIGTCISKLQDEVRTSFMADLEQCLKEPCDHMNAVGKLSVMVALNSSDDPFYLQDLLAAINTHLTPP